MLSKITEINVWHVIRRILVSITMLIAIIFFMQIAPGYVKDPPKTSKIRMILNNNIINNLKNDIIFIDNKTYLSIDDIRNYFDEFLKEEDNRFITTYAGNTAVIAKNSNAVYLNGEYINFSTQPLYDKENSKYYLSLDDLNKVYDYEMRYNPYTKVVIIDTKSKKLVKAKSKNNFAIKYKATKLSKTVDKIVKNDEIIIVQNDNNSDYEVEGWVRVRTPNAKIGYIDKNDIMDRNVAWDGNNKNDDLNRVSFAWEYYPEGDSAPIKSDKIEGINVVSPSFISVKSDGSVYSKGDENEKKYVDWAHKNGYKVYPTVSNISISNINDNTKIFQTFETREKVINQIVDKLVEEKVDGVYVDFERILLSDKDNYTRFIIELAAGVRKHNMKISVAVTPPDGAENWSLCYDRFNLAKAVDYMVFLSFDTHGVLSPVSLSSAYELENNINKFINNEAVPANKLVVSLPLYTRLWSENNGKVRNKVVNMKNITIPDKVEKQWNDTTKQYYIEYKSYQTVNKMWIEDETSIAKKLDIINKYNLKGAGFWELGREKADLWSVVVDKIK